MLTDMNYEFTEEDIKKIVNYLSIHDPENADRDYAIQLLQQMQDKAFNVASSGVLTEEEIAEALKKSTDN
jgi:predicted nucleic acid-binding protein